MERSHKIIVSRRAALCQRAFEAGIRVLIPQEWWSELAPLDKDERKIVLSAVHHAFRKGKINHAAT